MLISFKKYIFLFSALLLVIFCIPIQTKASLAPGIFVMDLKITSTTNNEIKGEFTVWNSEKYYLSDLNYEIKLFKGIEFEKLQLADSKVFSETFFIPPNQKITKTFTFQYPENINSGEYTLRAQVLTERGSELGWQDKKISLQGNNNFLDIINSSSRVLYNGKEHFTLEGVNINPEENVTAFLKVSNLGEAITVIPNIKIYKRQFNMPLAKEYQDAPITFAKGETKEIKLEMPKIGAPESYLAEVKFYKDNKQVSGIEYFRWVVKGQGGKILYAKADKDYYKAGESINLTIESIGPADFSDLGNGKLEITAYDKNDKLIATVSQDVALNPGLVSSLISIPVKKDTVSPKIDIKLIKNETVLDERIINLPVFSSEAKQIEKDQEKSNNKYIFFAILLISLIVVLIVGFFIFKLLLQKILR